MADMKEIQLEIKLPRDVKLPPAEGANFFQFALVAGEVQLIVGVMDLRDLHSARKAQDAGKRPEPIVPEVSHRFLLSQLGFEILRGKLNEIQKQLEDAE